VPSENSVEAPLPGGRPHLAAGVPPAIEDVLLDLLTQARTLLHADEATILLLDSTGSFLDTVAADGLDLNVRQVARVPVGRGFAGTVAATRAPLVIDQIRPDNVTNPWLKRQGLTSLVGVPLSDGAAPVGVLHVGSRHPRHFSDDEVDRLLSFAQNAGPALRTNFEQAELTASAVLQRSLVPARLPSIPGLDLAARYIPARGVLGGDWYDVFALPDNRIGFVIGDVAGHGLAAAVVMGRLRSALRAYALQSADPAWVVDSLNAKFRHFEPGAFATVLYAVADLPVTRMVVATAGHLPPLKLAPKDQESTYVDMKIDPPLGVAHDQPRRSVSVELMAGSGLLLFTDGLIERREVGATHRNLDALREQVHSGPAEDVCQLAIDAMFGDAGPGDDAALLAITLPA
jgi:sigma-B regulation protein RsbU (phosphoserine phosphatase)